MPEMPTKTVIRQTHQTCKKIIKYSSQESSTTVLTVPGEFESLCNEVLNFDPKAQLEYDGGICVLKTCVPKAAMPMIRVDPEYEVTEIGSMFIFSFVLSHIQIQTDLCITNIFSQFEISDTEVLVF